MTSITINPKRIWNGLLAASIFLIVMHIVTYYLFRGGILTYERARTFFNLNAEANLPTTFTVLVFGFSFILLAIIAAKNRQRKDKFAIHWAVLSVGMLLVSLDEGSMLHEIVVRPLTNLYSNNPFGIFTFGWVAILAVLLIVFVIVFFKFFLSLPLNSKKLFSLAVVIYLAGAMLFEALGGVTIRAYTPNSVQFFWVNTMEESLELIGMCLLAYALLRHLFEDGNGFEVTPV
jgi:hypothetical protein